MQTDRILSAWLGRISGCQLGRPMEVLSMQQGLGAVHSYLDQAGVLPLRTYIPIIPGSFPEKFGPSLHEPQPQALADDDLNYSVLALMMLEKHGKDLSTVDVARAWLNYLPFAKTWTAERAALTTMANHASELFAQGDEPGFDLARCAENQYDDWIGAQIRADVYGWVLPNQPTVAARLAREDAALSHRGEGIWGAMFVAALGASIPDADSLDAAVERALKEIPEQSLCFQAVQFARGLFGTERPVEALHERYAALSSVHVVNNLAVVVWALLSFQDDFSAAIGEAVCAGWDTDCNAATVGGLWGLQGKPIPTDWISPWNRRVTTDLAGLGVLDVDELAARTHAVAARLADR